MKFDERTEWNIETLHPKAQAKAREFMAAAVPIMAELGVVVRIISGTRSYKEQDALYAKGRTESGQRVTAARGGHSNHNFGIAWDIGIFEGKEYIEESPLYAELGAIGESLGLDWGGRWTTFRDEPHYEVKTGLTMSQKRAKIEAGKDLFS